MVLLKSITRWIITMRVLLIVAFSFMQLFTRSLSLSSRPHCEILASKRSVHQVSWRTSLLYSNQPNSNDNGERGVPSHDFFEEDSDYPSTHRRKSNGRTSELNLSDRDRLKLKAMSSFDGDDEWEEYANANFDDLLDNSNEVFVAATGASEMKTAAVDKTHIGEIKPNMAAISSQDETSAKIYELRSQSSTKQSKVENDTSLLHDVNALTDHGSSTKQLSQQHSSTILNNTASPQHLKLDSSVVSQQAGDEISVDEFRRKYRAQVHDTSVASAPAPAPAELNKSAGSTKIPRTRISNDQIEEIKSSISIVDVIESYNLEGFTRTNIHSAKACCPFHDDTNPSMSIDDDRGLYKCFACGAGGDLFNFIREFDALNRNKEKMGFMAAVQYAVREFGGKHLADLGNFDIQGRDWGDGMSDEAKAKVIEQEKKKDRIRHANNAAAAFYTKCLVILPTAGKARAYLRSRSISPDSIRTFAVGYAPDCYYGDERTQTWGEGSLVEYLSNLGFLPNEIVEAGLAVRTNPNSIKTVVPNEEDGNSSDFSHMMDRFRNRLVVPILDKSGQSVIGFGGRHLDSAQRHDDDKSSFVPAKYINSPESSVFRKKNILFNEHNAKIAVEEDSLDTKSSDKNETNRTMYTVGGRHLPVIIVEGYFDAMSLSNVGVKNVVASMGTALTVEQLKSAAEIFDSSSIVLCLDNDDAGRAAIERVCSSNMILKTPELSRSHILVATLPEDIKDPSDFLQGKGDDAKHLFATEVLNHVLPWDEWYIKQLASKFDAGRDDGTSFAAICEEVSSFLATFPNPADRTRRVHNIADLLLDLISDDSDNKSSLGIMRVQLESDMMNMVSRKASARESLERRIEERDGFRGEEATSNKIDVLTRGDTTEVNNDSSKLSKSALAKLKPPTQNTPIGISRNVAQSRRSFQPRQSRRTAYNIGKIKPRQQDLVPHFNGFTFKHKTDRDWLGLSGRSKPKMYLGTTGLDNDGQPLRAEMSIFDDAMPSKKRYKKEEVIYFNSNQYIGERYLTPQAMEAGYSLDDNDKPSAGESLIEFTDRMLLERNSDEMILQSESRLLHALAKFRQSRAIMRTVYSASTFISPNMEWTCEERQWLFQCLTGKSEPPLPQELLVSGTASQLRSYIANIKGCPPNAFIPDPSNSSGDHHNTEKPTSIYGKGHLETYFMDANHLFPSFKESKIAVETRAELTVQETVATLLRATAIKRFSSVKAKFSKIVFEMDHRAASDDTEQLERQQFFDEDFSNTSDEELRDLFESVGKEVMEAQLSLYESDRSTDRVNAHLLDYSTTNSVRYRTSQAQIERLEKMMEEHMANLPEDTHRPDVPGDDESYVFGSDEVSQQIDSRFGGRNPDDYDVMRGFSNGEINRV